MTFAPRTWVVGEVVDAAVMNQEIRDQFASMFDAWTAYTPAWIAEIGSAPSLGNGTLVGDYLKVGRRVDFRILLTWGSTTTGGGPNANWNFGLPAVPATAASWKLTHRGIQLIAAKSGGTQYSGTATLSATNGGVCRSFRDSFNLNSNAWDGDASSPFAAWAAGDTLHISGTYESAT
ncbi:hypothetical protein [Streptomyces sp. NPDC056707]|uniref:hypothetical protein n=1 Tax=Streptomyces sp. NPDC056707 TaxID=3345919 RepID=UPI0036A49F82